MSIKWHFYKQQSTDSIRNPISGEFFSTESVGNLTEALIREAFQNSLDARQKKEDGSRHTARTRIFVSGDQGALSAQRAIHWFGTLQPHLRAKGNGLLEQPGENDRCHFLVYEDFGTTGLTGDPEQHLIKEGMQNHFLNFFRAEGHSDKGEHDRGSWGVGKTVFPRSSRISTFFGLTVRCDDQRKYLLGRSILKYHSVGGITYKSDGYFGIERSDGFILPQDDSTVTAEFSRDFSLQRRTESGLSIVVPWYEHDGDEGITFESVVAAVFRGFFYPILMGHLSATVEMPGKAIKVDVTSLLNQVNLLSDSLSSEMRPLIELAEWAKTRLDSEFIELIPPHPLGAQVWDSTMVSEDAIGRIRSDLEQRRRIAVRVPMAVHPRGGETLQTYFCIFLEYSDKDSERPVFIRDELVISDVKPPRNSNIRSIVIVENGPLANLLRDAETPAHTQWNSDTRNFKNKYRFGPGAIKFVRNSVSELLKIVNQAEREPDPAITIDFFSIPAEPASEDAVAGRRKVPRGGKGANSAPPVPPIERSAPRFRITKLSGGFSIKRGEGAVARPSAIQVSVAYDVRRGNPLRKYSVEDFDLARPPISCKVADDSAVVLKTDSNKVLLKLLKDDFHFEITGFDADRDLYVRAEAREDANVD